MMQRRVLIATKLIYLQQGLLCYLAMIQAAEYTKNAIYV